jgi:hypothetical protein
MTGDEMPPDHHRDSPTMEKTTSDPEPRPDDAAHRWRERERIWARKLGRLRLGAEPLDEQLARYRRVTWGLTLVPCGIALLFIALFTVFGRPDIGLILVAILLGPVIGLAWLDYARLARKVRLYQDERARFLTSPR